MLRLFLLFVLLGIAQGQDKKNLAIPFTAEFLKPGMKKIETHTASIAISIQFREEEKIDAIEQKKTWTQKWESCVLEAQKGIVSTLKVNYLESVATQKIGNLEETIDILLTHNKEYVLEKTAQEVVVKSQTELMDDEKFLVKNDFSNFGKPDVLFSIFSEKKFKIGQKIAITDNTAKEILGIPQGSVQEFFFVVKDFKVIQGRPCAILETTIKTTSQAGNMISYMNLSGEMVIGVKNCWLMSLQLKGNIASKGTQEIEDRTIAISGDGKIELKILVEHK